MHKLRLSDVDLRLIRTFIAIVDGSGLSAAAAQLNVSLTSISRSLSELETRLDARLCHRGRSGFRLTAQGGEVYAASRRLLSEINEFELTLAMATGGGMNRLRIGTIDSTFSNPSSKILSGLKALISARPDMLIELSVHPSTTIELAVRDRRLDIGISVSPVHLQSLEYRLAFEEEQAIYVARSASFYERCKAMRPDQVLEATIPAVLRTYDTPGFSLLKETALFHRAAIVDGAESAAAAITAGLGVGQLPVQLADKAGGGDLERLPFPGTPRIVPMYIFWRSDVGRDPSVRTFVGHYGK